MDSHENFGVGRDGLGDFFQLQGFGSTVIVEADRFHGRHGNQDTGVRGAESLLE